MRIGILGGSFNPFHTMHLRLAIEVYERLCLDRLDVVPCALPPHKHTQGLLPFALRTRCIALALGLEGTARPEKGLTLNTLEQERQGPSFTIDTLNAYHEREPGCSLYFIMGSSDLLTLPSWKKGLELPKLASLVVVPRLDTDLKAVREFVAAHWPEAKHHPVPPPHDHGVKAIWEFAGATRLDYLPLPRMDVSATMIRTAWLQGRSLRGLVPESVMSLLETERTLVDNVWREPASE